MYYNELFIPYKYTRSKFNKLQIILFGVLYITLWSTFFSSLAILETVLTGFPVNVQVRSRLILKAILLFI